jgi:hypothetical protein
VSFEDFIQKSMKGLLGLGFKDFWAYYPTTLVSMEIVGNSISSTLSIFSDAMTNYPSCVKLG